jgi:SAM-dependent methyltransferase
MVFYNHFNYPRYWVNRRYEDGAERIVLARFFKKIKNRNSIIDIGAGYGRLFSGYLSYFKSYLLIEPSGDLYLRAKQNLPQNPSVRVRRGSAENLPTGNESFDVALLVRVSHHLADLQKPLREIHRVLKSPGYLIIEFANKYNFKAFMKAAISRRLSFFSHLPVNLSQTKQQLFINYHPNQILTLLKANDFQIITTASVSNFRLATLKKVVPLKWLLFMEKYFSLLTSHFSPIRYFGPSIFVLARKN